MPKNCPNDIDEPHGAVTKVDAFSPFSIPNPLLLKYKPASLGEIPRSEVSQTNW